MGCSCLWWFSFQWLLNLIQVLTLSLLHHLSRIGPHLYFLIMEFPHLMLGRTGWHYHTERSTQRSQENQRLWLRAQLVSQGSIVNELWTESTQAPLVLAFVLQYSMILTSLVNHRLQPTYGDIGVTESVVLCRPLGKGSTCCLLFSDNVSKPSVQNLIAYVASHDLILHWQ